MAFHPLGVLRYQAIPYLVNGCPLRKFGSGFRCEAFQKRMMAPAFLTGGRLSALLEEAFDQLFPRHSSWERRATLPQCVLEFLSKVGDIGIEPVLEELGIARFAEKEGGRWIRGRI
jgi:hypothetical protein